MPKKIMKILLLLVVLSSLTVLLRVFYGRNHIISNRLPSLSPNVSAGPTPSQTMKSEEKIKNTDNDMSPRPSVTPSHPSLIRSDVSYVQLTQPATCHVGGKITFLSPTTAQHENADLTYTGIDSPARLIKWQITPSDVLAVGPNLTASIKLPDGKEPIGVVLPERPTASSYKLYASMTYGRLVNNNIKVSEVQCSGQTEVLLNF